MQRRVSIFTLLNEFQKKKVYNNWGVEEYAFKATRLNWTEMDWFLYDIGLRLERVKHS